MASSIVIFEIDFDCKDFTQKSMDLVCLSIAMSWTDQPLGIAVFHFGRKGFRSHSIAIVTMLLIIILVTNRRGHSIVTIRNWIVCRGISVSKTTVNKIVVSRRDLKYDVSVLNHSSIAINLLQ